MFKKLGIGLGAEDKYHRAYEKGVLLEDFGKAKQLFEEAAAEFEKRGNPEGRDRAVANAHFYGYLKSGNVSQIDALIESLRPLSEIECIGSETETMPVGRLIAELEARKAEAEVATMGDSVSTEAVAAAHEKARDKFAVLGGGTMVTYTYFGNDPFQGSAERHQFLHSGKACWYRCQLHLATDPATAADEMSQAVLYFRHADDKQEESKADQLLNNLRMQRTCWVCGREMQAQGVNFEYLPTTLRPYHLAVIEKSKQDTGTLLVEESRVAVCVVCRDLIMNQARTIANDMVSHALSPIINHVNALNDQVAQLARMAHHH